MIKELFKYLKEHSGGALLLCFLVCAYLIPLYFKYTSNIDLEELVSRPILSDSFKWYQPIVSIFVHANLSHYISNLAFIITYSLFIGLLSNRWGLIFLVCMLGSYLADISFCLYNTSEDYRTIGSSGYAYGLIGIYFILFIKRVIKECYTSMKMFMPFAISLILIVNSIIETITLYGVEENRIGHYIHTTSFIFSIFIYVIYIYLEKKFCFSKNNNYN